MSDVHEFINASQAFFNRLGDVRLAPLAIALLFHTANLLLRTRAWYAILRAAYPNARYRWRSCAGAYLSGVGVNAVIPARGGDLLKLYLVRLRLPESRIATVVATLARRDVARHVHRPVPVHLRLPRGRRAARARPAPPAGVRVLGRGQPPAARRAARSARWCCSGCLLLRHAIRVARDFRERVRQGFTILRQPRRYLVQVATPQAIGWMCRVGTMFYLLRAFGIHADIRNALLVLVVGSASTLLPLTPGGVGTQQALIVVVLSGQATDSTLLSFSVGHAGRHHGRERAARVRRADADAAEPVAAQGDPGRARAPRRRAGRVLG